MSTVRTIGTAMTPRVASRGAPAARAAVASVAIAYVGMLALAILFDASGWSWVLVTGIGFVAGAVAGRPRNVWLALVGVVLWHATAIALDLPRDSGPFWYIAAIGSGILLATAYVIGADVGWRTPPLAATQRGWSSLGRWGRRLLIIAVIAAVVLPIGYSGVILAIGPNMFTHPDAASDCRTPAAAYGWTYEAINYDIASDQALAPSRITNDGVTSWICGGTPAPAGNAVVTSDGIRLAGWYIPAANGAGASAPTVLLVHGWKANKTGMLPFAPGLHGDYNLVLFDLRNNGQSSGDMTSMGLWEQRDVTRMLDWVAATKHPSWIGVVGNSMGAATVLAVAAGDQRVKALILDSAHADVVTSFGNAMEEDFSYPGGPAAWILAQGVSAQVGGDITTTDPVRHIGQLGDRPVLLTAGAIDQVDTPGEATGRNIRAALDAGVPVEVAYCRDARHGKVIEKCPDAWASWAHSFFDRARNG
jgi:pimeloyl-ACP methyl ester carboxylesterase